MQNRIVLIRDHEDNFKILTNFPTEVYRVLDLGGLDPKASEVALSFKSDEISENVLMVDPVVLAPTDPGPPTEFNPRLADDVAAMVQKALLRHQRYELEKWLATAEKEFELLHKEITENRQKLEGLANDDGSTNAPSTGDSNSANA